MRTRLVLAGAVALVGVACVAALVLAPPLVPSFDAVRAGHRPSDVPLLDRHGVVVHELRTDPGERRLGWSALAEISPALRDTVIAAEDRRFATHHGVDWRALAGAAIGRVARRPARGASTITMQLAALLDPALTPPSHGRTLRQKLRQLRAALAIEPHGLSTAEALVLAALLPNPNAGAEMVRRRASVLAAASPAVVNDGELAAAAARLDAPAVRRAHADLAPHLAHRLLTGRLAPVTSTLDVGLQRVARDALQRALLSLTGRHVEDGAVLVADNASGDVLAYVGGSGGLSHARFVDTVRARRQPGSTLKPFLYGLAFERRLLTPASLVADTPLALAVAGGLYRPRDYDSQFRGLVSTRTALASSLNVPAVRTLDLVGGDAFVETLRGLGFAAATESGDYYGPALALGGADVTLWELVTAYRAIANGGVCSSLRVTLDARDTTPPRRIFSSETAFQLTDILADRDSRSLTFGLESALATRFFSAVKTGTSKEMRDNWCLGFSERYTVGVWVGNASGAPMHDVSGIVGAAPVWLEVMSFLHRATPSAAPSAPAGLVAASVDFPDALEPTRREWFASGTEPGTRALAIGEPRIVAPVTGTIVALDPDIPADRQRVPLEVTGASLGLRWRLDDTDLGPARGLTLWEPEPGTHTVALVDDRRRERDVATFEVRGSRRAR
jgi:penicillin-binding protein 1C